MLHDISIAENETVFGIVIEVLYKIPGIAKPICGPAPRSSLPKELRIQVQAKQFAGMDSMIYRRSEKTLGRMIGKCT